MLKQKSNLIKSTAGIFIALQIIGVAAILSCSFPTEALAANEIPESLRFTPQISIPNSNFISGAGAAVGAYNQETGKMDSTLLAQYIGAIYNYGMAIAGILATIVLMGAGVIWLTSGGDSGKITQAKDLISGSVAGLLILVVSWVILNTINPDLVQLKAIKTTNLERVDLAYLTCCSPTQGEIKTPVTIKDGKKIAMDGDLVGKEIKCTSSALECTGGQVCDLYAGENNQKYGCVDNNFCCACVGTQRSDILAKKSCQTNMTREGCISWCDSITDAFWGWDVSHFSPLLACRQDGECGLKD